MKKLLLISLVGIVLVGCGENKVTKEMLIGQWECSLIGRVAKWKDGNYQEYVPIKNDSGTIKYFMKDDTLYFNFGTKNSYPYDLSSYYNKSELLKSQNGAYLATKKSIQYISHDQFKTIEETEIIFEDDENKNKKVNIEITCNRTPK
ncbi:hypothetical protein A9G34_08805 [Gilliamella sp. Choc4-2]|jgi:hypothetical protein|uniref:hypothetical protein n=1 Tax=unclassified Gilliamella TaxID=2685620 RepID=UPI0004DCB5B3|nr:hypothetical protein [Gilliamella apicola]KFA59773.1 hypothetical protein GAPWKB11_0516 [Gilliamella apicola]OCG29964.1 hypothetical protein A9G33_08840 [Gilliamella apicola]OCG43683.1 hypothetical protein A9G34_08805 [Gilliamella apicola]OCG53440.1 hypothetical protein A9G36_01215 [Gilliamella apicola]OCG65448.1 hypothetical protein A9G48_10730 [Gilliamella apicola]